MNFQKIDEEFSRWQSNKYRHTHTQTHTHISAWKTHKRQTQTTPGTEFWTDPHFCAIPSHTNDTAAVMPTTYSAQDSEETTMTMLLYLSDSQVRVYLSSFVLPYPNSMLCADPVWQRAIWTKASGYYKTMPVSLLNLTGSCMTDEAGPKVSNEMNSWTVPYW